MENAICENYEKKKNQKEHKPQIGHIIQSVGGGRCCFKLKSLKVLLENRIIIL